MLPPAALAAAQRLRAALMTVVRAVADIARTGSTPTLTNADAEALYLRLARLITTIVRISDFGIRTRATPTGQPHPAPRPAPIPRTTTVVSLPRRPGWLLEALPGVAATLAATLRPLLSDPVLAPLLAVPALGRTLRPLLRSLDLVAGPPRAKACKPRKPPNRRPTTHPAFRNLVPVLLTLKQRYLTSTTIAPLPLWRFYRPIC